MLSLGGLYDKNEVKLLSLYVLANLGRALTAQQLSETVVSEGLCDYFTVSEGISELTLSGHIIEDKLDNHLYITDLGTQTNEQLYATLPVTVREKAMSAAFLTVSALDRDAQMLCDITEDKQGYTVHMKIVDMDISLMSLSLSVPNIRQARQMKKRFKESAETLYRNMIEQLTED